jgi:hypothetical protein
LREQKPEYWKDGMMERWGKAKGEGIRVAD